MQIIFNDPGMSNNLLNMYSSLAGSDWQMGRTTATLLATLADYLTDLTSWLEPPLLKRAVEAALCELVQRAGTMLLAGPPSSSPQVRRTAAGGGGGWWCVAHATAPEAWMQAHVMQAASWSYIHTCPSSSFQRVHASAWGHDAASMHIDGAEPWTTCDPCRCLHAWRRTSRTSRRGSARTCGQTAWPSRWPTWRACGR